MMISRGISVSTPMRGWRASKLQIEKCQLPSSSPVCVLLLGSRSVVVADLTEETEVGNKLAVAHWKGTRKRRRRRRRTMGQTGGFHTPKRNRSDEIKWIFKLRGLQCSPCPRDTLEQDAERHAGQQDGRPGWARTTKQKINSESRVFAPTKGWIRIDCLSKRNCCPSSSYTSFSSPPWYNLLFRDWWSWWVRLESIRVSFLFWKWPCDLFN